MQAVASTLPDTLAALKLGAARQHANLAVFPLVAASEAAPDYLTLDEALAAGLARVAEVSEAGHVPELLFENAADRSVLLVDGEELVGARQNRILNLSLLVGAMTTLTIPVSCVERGRWSYRTREFGTGGESLFSRARAEQARDVSRTLREYGSRGGDQLRVWNEIDRKQAAMGVESATGAMSDAYAQRRADVDGYRTAFEAQPGQVGAVFAINGRVRGLELFDAAATFAKFLRKILGSYALDAAEEARVCAGLAPPPWAAQAFVDKLASAHAAAFPALARGEDVRLDLPDLAGGALVVDGRVVHLAAFPVEERPVEDGAPLRRASGW